MRTQTLIVGIFATLALFLAGCDAANAPTASPDDVSLDDPSQTQDFGPPDREIPALFAGAIDFDREARTVTLPLYTGEGPDGQAVYYIITETSDFRTSDFGDVNWAPKLANALSTEAVQTAAVRTRRGTPARTPRTPPGGPRFVNLLQKGLFTVQFPGTVDFSPERSVVPGPDLFPLDPASTAGSVGDAVYSPLFTVGGGLVLNAPHVANETGVHDDVLAIDEDAMTVTLTLVPGFYEEDPVLYISTEASQEDIAALESATYAPTLNAAPAAGNRTTEQSAREAIIPIVNGPRGIDHPERQGLRSAVAGEGPPLNIIREEPECSDPTDCSALLYSPLWDVHPVVWTQAAIDADQQRRLTTHEDVIALFQDGALVSGAPNGVVNADLGGLRAAGVIVNCPNIFQERSGDDDEE